LTVIEKYFKKETVFSRNYNGRVIVRTILLKYRQAVTNEGPMIYGV